MPKYFTLFTLIIAMTFVIPPLALAHDGDNGHVHGSSHHQTRQWTIVETGSAISGSFVSSRDGKILIRQDDGWIRPVQIDRLIDADQQWIRNRLLEIAAINTQPEFILTAQPVKSFTSKVDSSTVVESFKAFEKFVKVRADEDFVYVESNGMPDHQMMVGITAWQQQVPLPQAYTGDNAWRIPLNPVPAKNPMSAKTNFFRGAIALAVNGIPIFNPIKNDGRTDTLIAGELDKFGGHCGRADDYHYHIAPIHLQKIAGTEQPLAWALDGYPIFGYQDEKSPDFAPLDSLNGHKDANGQYHYHATKKYPYLNGGFYGEVVERDGQVDPQPRAEPVRPALTPLRDAKITDFVQTKPGSYRLTYDLRGKKGTVSYTIADNKSVAFEYVRSDGTTTKEEYSSNRRGGGGGRRPGDGQNPPPPEDGKRPPRDGKRPPRKSEEPVDSAKKNASAMQTNKTGQLTVTSSSLDSKGMLSVKCTCDGDSESPAVEWKDLPKGTKSIAISLWHTAPDQEKSYWVVYNISPDVTKLAQNSKGVGTLGINDRSHAEYDPMCSKGPGVKTYHITVFAISEELKLSASEASRAKLLEAVKGITLSEATLDFKYERK